MTTINGIYEMATLAAAAYIRLEDVPFSDGERLSLAADNPNATKNQEILPKALADQLFVTGDNPWHVVGAPQNNDRRSSGQRGQRHLIS